MSYNRLWFTTWMPTNNKLKEVESKLRNYSPKSIVSIPVDNNLIYVCTLRLNLYFNGRKDNRIYIDKTLSRERINII